jgi:hypothetical protein
MRYGTFDFASHFRKRKRKETQYVSQDYSRSASMCVRVFLIMVWLKERGCLYAAGALVSAALVFEPRPIAMFLSLSIGCH